MVILSKFDALDFTDQTLITKADLQTDEFRLKFNRKYTSRFDVGLKYYFIRLNFKQNLLSPNVIWYYTTPEPVLDQR